MSSSTRNTFVLLGALLVLGLSASSFGQIQNDIKTPDGPVGYSDKTPVHAGSVVTLSTTPLLHFPTKAITSRGGASFDINGLGGPGVHPNQIGNSSDGDQDGPNELGLDSVPTFARAFVNNNPSILDPIPGGLFPYVMIGNHPLVGGTTIVHTHITAVTLQLLNDNGSVRANVPYAPFEDLTLNSPNFQDADYSVGHTQFGDAIQRAEFFNMMEENWHTLLKPRIVNRVTVQIPRHVHVQLPNGSIVSVQAYFVGTAPDGSLFVEMLDLLFNVIFDNLTINDINAGNFKTKSINIEAFPNTFLFSIDNTGAPAGCCVLGFHSYFFDPTATPQPRWMALFTTWISPGLFGPGFQDVLGMSHEISETLDDPFGNTIVPTWQFPGVPANDNVDCQANMENSDPIEGLANAPFPVTIGHGKNAFTYHPQNAALLQWFAMGPTSNAISGAFSYPNTAVLPQSAVPCPQ